MSEKSFVTIEQNQCPICLTTFDTGAILMDRRVRETFEHFTMTGHSPCPTCKEKLDDDFIVMIEINADAVPDHHGKIQPDRVTYQGRHAFLKRRVAVEMFDNEPESINFCDGELLDMLDRLAEQNSPP